MQTILCVEDEIDLRADIREELEAAGYRVLEAANGKEALAALDAEVPDLVLCDITMPQMSGLEVLARVRENAQLADLPFIFLTALAGRSDLLAGKAAGVDDYLTKPIDYDLMLITIAARLSQVARIKAHLAPAEPAVADESIRLALSGANEALNRLAVGVFLLDSERKVVFRNRRGEELLEEADGLSLSLENFLRGEKPQQTQALRDAVDRAMEKGSAGARDGSQAVALTRHSGKRSLVAICCPLSRGPAQPGTAAVGVFVTDPERRLSSVAEAVAHLYGLSPAETRIALALSRGLRLDEIADEFGISRNTVSYTMKNLFRKTETDRQADLISLFIASPVAPDLD